jgi:hypothetical protein
MPQRGYRGVAGSPIQPWINFTCNQGSDIWLRLTFLSYTNQPIVPVTLTYRIDCLTTDYVVLTTTPYTGSLSSVVILNIPGSLNSIGGGPNAFNIGQTSQNNQVTVTATFSDGSTQVGVFVYEVIAIQTVGGE